jgi:tripartite-type tricarboxylate transporter receptor subunit TctC
MFQIQPRKFLVALMLLSLLFFSWGAKAQFPDRPITLVVPYGPGSAIDAVARALGVGAQKSLGQQVIIENKSGAGGALGAVYAGRKPADGYTLAVISINPFVLSYFSKAMPLHPVDDFTQVISTSLYLMAVAVRSDSKIKDMSELMEQIKNNPPAGYTDNGTQWVTTNPAPAGYIDNGSQYVATTNKEAKVIPA